MVPKFEEMYLRYPSTPEQLLRADIERLLFVNGQFDPTHALSPTTADAKNGVLVLDIGKAGHCYDLNIPHQDDTVEVRSARIQETDLIKKWINEYHFI